MKTTSILIAIFSIFIYGCSAETKEGVENLVEQSKDAIKSLDNNAAFLDDDNGRGRAFAIAIGYGLQVSECQKDNYKCRYRVTKEFYETSIKFRDHYVNLNKTFVKPPQELLDSSAWNDACLRIIDNKYSNNELPFKEGDLVRVASILFGTFGSEPNISQISTSSKREIGVFVKQQDNEREAYKTHHVFKRAVQIVPESACAEKGIPRNEQIGQKMILKYRAEIELDKKFDQDQREKTIAEAQRLEEEDRLINELQKQARATVDNNLKARVKEIESSKLSYVEKSDEINKVNKLFGSDKYHQSILFPLYKKNGLDRLVFE